MAFISMCDALTKLHSHPDSRRGAVSGIGVKAARYDGVLKLRYRVSGDIGRLRLPPIAASTRTDDLWRHTCFEVFLRAAPNEGYYELNLAPSSEWAAYQFKSYRSGRRDLDVRPPEIDVRSHTGCVELRAAIEMETFSNLSYDAVWSLGLAAIIEETDGNLSYWALAQPPGNPDFHRADCFALALPPTPLR